MSDYSNLGEEMYSVLVIFYFDLSFPVGETKMNYLFFIVLDLLFEIGLDKNSD